MYSQVVSERARDRGKESERGEFVSYESVVSSELVLSQY